NILIDNVGDKGEAAAKGFGTGLTLDLAGSLVTDGYVFTGTYQAAGKAPITKVYKHALHSTIGNAKGPERLTPMTVQQAFDKVLKDLVLDCVLDLQKEEGLSKGTPQEAEVRALMPAPFKIIDELLAGKGRGDNNHERQHEQEARSPRHHRVRRRHLRMG